MAEKQAAKQRKKIAYDKKELDDLTKQMPDPNEDLLIGKFKPQAWKKHYLNISPLAFAGV